MMKQMLVLTLVLTLFLASSVVFAQEEGLSKEQIIEIATEAVKAENIALEGVDPIYDEENQLWQGRVTAIKGDESDPNQGNLPADVLADKKYQVVFFDFVEEAPTKDIWVFVDLDTGEVITTYQEE